MLQPPVKYIIKTKPEKRGKMGKIKQQPITSRTDFFYYAFRNILLVSLPLAVMCGLVLSHLSLHSSATVSNSESDSLTLTLSTSCTLSSSVEEAHTASLNGGQYEDDIGITKVNAYCNDNNGYSIYAIGSSGDTDGNTDLISNINDNYNIHTGIYDSSSITASSSSTWSMKLTAGVGSGINTTPPTINNNYSNYNVVPNIYTLVASRASKTDMTIDTSVTGSYFTTTYDIYASSLQPAGTYTGKVKYLMVHPQSNVPYWANTIEESFAGAGKQKVYSSKAGGYYYSMQDMTSDICGLVAGNGDSTSAQLIDTRDDNVYWVAKLKDGHCWMTQNLDLAIVADAQDPTKMKTLTSEDTDLTDHSLTGAYSQANGYSYDENTGITSWTPASSVKTINFKGTTVTGWQNSNTEPYSASKTDDTNTGHASLGNYYNWTAAIASNNSSSLTQDTINDISKNPQNSICPKGWRLPTISDQSEITVDSTNEFARLNYLYNSNAADTDNGLISGPLWFVRAGDIWRASFSANSGYYLSGTVKSNSQIYSLYFKGNTSNSSYGDSGRVSGRSVRCVAR